MNGMDGQIDALREANRKEGRAQEEGGRGGETEGASRKARKGSDNHPLLTLYHKGGKPNYYVRRSALNRKTVMQRSGG